MRFFKSILPVYLFLGGLAKGAGLDVNNHNQAWKNYCDTKIPPSCQEGCKNIAAIFTGDSNVTAENGAPWIANPEYLCSQLPPEGSNVTNDQRMALISKILNVEMPQCFERTMYDSLADVIFSSVPRVNSAEQVKDYNEKMKGRSCSSAEFNETLALFVTYPAKFENLSEDCKKSELFQLVGAMGAYSYGTNTSMTPEIDHVRKQHEPCGDVFSIPE